MTLGLSVVGFILSLCFVAGFLVASRAAKTGVQTFFLTILFGVVFLIALTGLAVAGCVAVFSTAR
jgi:hypothetical protein